MSDSNRASLVRHNVHAPHLFATAAGRILHCTCCGRIQIEFGGALFLITTDAFDALRGTVAEALDDASPGASPHGASPSVASPHGDTASDDAGVDRPGTDDAAATWRLRVAGDGGRHTIPLNRDQLRALQVLLDSAHAMRVLRERLRAVANGACRDRAVQAHAQGE